MTERVDKAEAVRNYYRRQGVAMERKRIIELMEKTPFIWMGDVQLIQISRDELIKLINGEN